MTGAGSEKHVVSHAHVLHVPGGSLGSHQQKWRFVSSPAALTRSTLNVAENPITILQVATALIIREVT